MSERFPWEDGATEVPASPGADQAPPAWPAQMELEAPLAPTPQSSLAEPASPTGPADAPREPIAELPHIASAVPPGDDPHRTQQTTPPAELIPAASRGGEGGDATAPRPHGDPLRHAQRERSVARKEYYSIGEVSDLAGLPAHVLRYWESQFPVLNPSKNRSGNRAYQRKEIKLILLVKHLLYEEKYTVEGAKAKLDQLRRGGLLHEQTAKALDTQTLSLLRDDVAELRDLLARK